MHNRRGHWILQIRVLQIRVLQIRVLQIRVLQIQSVFYKSNPVRVLQYAQKSIYNSISLCVRSKLAPRELEAVNHGVEAASLPLVQYAKTDAIFHKELTKWTAKNVAELVASN